MSGSGSGGDYINVGGINISISDADPNVPYAQEILDISLCAAILPAYLTPLLGREQEVQAVSSLVQRAEVRLVTLTGPGGIGKTRLGTQVATLVAAHFSDGAYFIPLASVSDPDLVVASIAHVLGLRDTGDWSLWERLKAFML